MIQFECDSLESLLKDAHRQIMFYKLFTVIFFSGMSPLYLAGLVVDPITGKFPVEISFRGDSRKSNFNNFK